MISGSSADEALRQKLHKIEALFSGAATAGEKAELPRFVAEVRRMFANEELHMHIARVEREPREKAAAALERGGSSRLIPAFDTGGSQTGSISLRADHNVSDQVVSFLRTGQHVLRISNVHLRPHGHSCGFRA